MSSQKRPRPSPAVNTLASYFKPQAKPLPTAPVSTTQDWAFITALAKQYHKPSAAIAELVRLMTSSDPLPLMSKYQPKTEVEIFDRESVDSLKDFLTNFQPGTCASPQALLLVGPCGCGKTSLVRAVTRSLGLLLIEMSAKEPRHSQALMRVLGEATQTRKIEAISKASIVLLDDVDAVFECDKGFQKTVCDLISRTKLPVVMTATDPPYEFIDRPDVVTMWLTPIADFEATLKISIINHAERLSIPEFAYRPLFLFHGENMGRTLNSMQLKHLDLIFGLQMPVTALAVAGSDIEAESTGVNWLADNSEHNLDTWLDFVHRNQDCVDLTDVDAASAFADVLSLFDLFSAGITRSVQREKDGLNAETQQKYGLNLCIHYLDEVATRNLSLYTPLKLRCHDSTPLKLSPRTRKRPPRRPRKRPAEPAADE